MERSPDSRCWRVVAPERLAVRTWDDEAVVYDDATGSTHLLAPLSAAALAALLAERLPMTARAMGRALGDESDAMLRQVESSMVAMQHSGLVTTRQP